MIDHVTLNVGEYAAAKEFFSRSLAPLGYNVVKDFPEWKAVGLGQGGKPDFWLAEKQPVGNQHVAVAAPSRAAVDAFYQAALAAGAKDNGAPGIRADYHPAYYAAFVFDADGNNIEAVTHKPE